MEAAQQALEKVDKVKPSIDKRLKPVLKTWKIISGLNSLYKFLKIGGIIICSVAACGWFLFWVNGTSQYSQDQLNAAQNYANGYAAKVVAQFNPHLEVLAGIGILLVVFIFLAYIAQAMAKLVEKATENEYQ